MNARFDTKQWTLWSFQFRYYNKPSLNSQDMNVEEAWEAAAALRLFSTDINESITTRLSVSVFYLLGLPSGYGLPWFAWLADGLWWKMDTFVSSTWATQILPCKATLESWRRPWVVHAVLPWPLLCGTNVPSNVWNSCGCVKSILRRSTRLDTPPLHGSLFSDYFTFHQAFTCFKSFLTSFKTVISTAAYLMTPSYSRFPARSSSSSAAGSNQGKQFGVSQVPCTQRWCFDETW